MRVCPTGAFSRTEVVSTDRPGRRANFRVFFQLMIGAAPCIFGCRAGHPSDEQIKAVNEMVDRRADVRWDLRALLACSNPSPEPTGDLTLADARERALAHNLSLVASAENLSIAHAQMIQAGLLQNPVLGQSSGLLFPFNSHGGYPTVDGNIQQNLNTLFTQPGRVSLAKLQEMQANIDLASQAYLLAQQVDAKYQEMIQLLRRRELLARIEQLYSRAVQAAEARRKVGIIATPDLNRARLNYEDARRQLQHLTTQYGRASRDMNWLMGYPTTPRWRLPPAVVHDVSAVPALQDLPRLESLGLSSRLDLLRADFDRKIGRRSVELARFGMFPQLTVGAEFARDGSHNVAGGPWLVGLTLPIFDPGIVATELAKAQARKAEKTFDALQGQVRQDVRTAFDNWRIAADDVVFFQSRQIPQQEQNVQLMEKSFRLGNDDFDTLLNVYQNYVSQLQSYEDAIQAYHDSAVALQQAVGLTWERILIQPAPIQPPSAQPTVTTGETGLTTAPSTLEAKP